MYLANDVIQNSKRKGPEYGKEFLKVLQKAFAHIGETCSSDEKTIGSLSRILKIWADRGVYDPKTVQEYRDALNANIDVSEKSTAQPVTSGSKRKDKTTEEQRESAKKHKASVAAGAGQQNRERVKSETIEVNGTVETHVILSQHIPAGDPPEPEELIKALTELENSASSDAVVRERIANLPPEVSEVAMLSKLEDKEAAAKLAAQVNIVLGIVLPPSN